MGRRGKTTKAGEHLLFDVLYEDGTRSSNRKVPNAELGDLDRALSAKAYIEAQDREIAEVSGKPRGPIKTLSRSQAK
jgi:hypothetical protein